MKTVSTKVDNGLYEKLIESCNGLGCSVSEKLRELVINSISNNPTQTENESKSGKWHVKIDENGNLLSKEFVQEPTELRNIKIINENGKITHYEKKRLSELPQGEIVRIIK